MTKYLRILYTFKNDTHQFAELKEIMNCICFMAMYKLKQHGCLM